MTLQNYPAWNRLIGAVVEIRQNGQVVSAGVVEDAMPDSSALWIAADGVQARSMYESALNYQVWVEPQQLAGKTCYRMTSAQLYPMGPDT
ncbi:MULTISPECIES: hypothetical protein [unclassified Pseudarthrobacter]|uniref:hypothetical protein n=1 Tax=unclassified Pseudarthrobacter TaxID=2647000 RepID=UPI0030780629